MRTFPIPSFDERPEPADRDRRGLSEEGRLEPLAIMPCQVVLAPPRSRRSAEMRLLFAVLADGVDSYCRAVERGRVRDARFRELESWLRTRGSAALTSFDHLCDLFEVDAGRLRAALWDLRDTSAGSRI